MYKKTLPLAELELPPTNRTGCRVKVTFRSSLEHFWQADGRHRTTKWQSPQRKPGTLLKWKQQSDQLAGRNRFHPAINKNN
jgi:hypothetical protein